MNINFRDADIKDKMFILNANKEINILSGLNHLFTKKSYKQ